MREDGRFGVVTNSRLPKNIGLFCKRALEKRLYSAKETYIFKEPTNRSPPIGHTCAHIHSHAHTNSVSLSHTHTHTHTHLLFYHGDDADFMIKEWDAPHCNTLQHTASCRLRRLGYGVAMVSRID